MAFALYDIGTYFKVFSDSVGYLLAAFVEILCLVVGPESIWFDLLLVESNVKFGAAKHHFLAAKTDGECCVLQPNTIQLVGIFRDLGDQGFEFP